MLPQLKETIAATVGTAGTERIAVIDNHRRLICNYDTAGVEYIGEFYDLPVIKTTSAVRAAIDEQPRLLYTINGENQAQIESVYAIGSPVGFLPPISTPSGLVLPHNDGEGIVRFYRRVSGAWQTDSALAVGRGLALIGNQTTRFAGCHYDNGAGQSGFLSIVGNAEAVDNFGAGFTTPRQYAFRTASHNSFAQKTAITLPANVVSTIRRGGSIAGGSNGLPLAAFNICSIKQIGVHQSGVIVLAATVYRYQSSDAFQLTQTLAVPGVIVGNNNNIIVRTPPSLIIMGLNLATNTITFHEPDISPSEHSLHAGAAIGNYAFPYSAAANTSYSAIGKRFYRLQYAFANPQLHSGLYGADEFGYKDITAASQLSDANAAVVVADFPANSINTMWSEHFTGAAGETFIMNIYPVSIEMQNSQSLLSIRNPFTRLGSQDRSSPRSFGFRALVECTEMHRLGDFWSVVINGVRYICTEYAHTADNRAAATFLPLQVSSQ